MYICRICQNQIGTPWLWCIWYPYCYCQNCSCSRDDDDLFQFNVSIMNDDSFPCYSLLFSCILFSVKLTRFIVVISYVWCKALLLKPHTDSKYNLDEEPREVTDCIGDQLNRRLYIKSIPLQRYTNQQSMINFRRLNFATSHDYQRPSLRHSTSITTVLRQRRPSSTIQEHLQKGDMEIGGEHQL